MYTLEDVYKTFPSGCTEDYKILRAFEMGKQSKEKRIADLEKENAELKAKNKWYSEQVCNKECAEVWGQLTNAKEIIREFVEWATWQGSNCPNFKSIQDKAEQFLSEVENV